MTENCWVLTLANGTEIDNGHHVEHFTKAKADQRIADHQPTHDLMPGIYADATPRQLDQPCVTVTCSCCDEEFDESGEGYTVHFQNVEEARTLTEADWTVRPDGTYRCTACSPDGGCDTCWAERKAVASRG